MRGTGKSNNTINPTSVKEKYEALNKVCEHLWIEKVEIYMRLFFAEKKNGLT